MREDLIGRVGQRSGASAAVLDAMRAIPREAFMPGVELDLVYRDGPYPIGHGQTISQPTVIAMMTDAMKPRPTSRVLEIGTGCGYQTAILAKLVDHVFSVEVVPELGESAKKRLSQLGIDNVSLKVGDGYAGWPKHAPFDAIIVTAAPAERPTELENQLADRGIMVVPVGARFSQDLLRLQRHGDRIEQHSLGPVAFVPMVHGPS
jgi:protein-L-isoaspartate(D-aspartate) O-methyltransferase